DRPSELLDAGANQAINQVNHYGSFVRHFFSLPAPTDVISTRMVLTTFDSAVYLATSTPCGPVHINCPFREPLESTPKEWSQSCLKGLESWVSSGEPFTNYIQPHSSFSPNNFQSDVADVLGIIHGAKRGLLLIGAVFKEDDIWAALLLAKHLQWPVVADILSGLRLRKYKNSISKLNEGILFVDHLDHSLLSAEVKDWIKADVIVQIGSRITSKRISQMLEKSLLTEPYVAHITSEALDCGSTMFLGNSMPIRDADMYGNSPGECTHGNDTSLISGFPFRWIQVAGNRGASGIDGLLSTAVGFSVGHNKRVVCVMGDVSFLHDTNGLALLKQRISRKHVTVLVINNHGGAIFSLLPIANKAEDKILNQYFYTSHNVGIHNLCSAHGVKHVQVQTKAELQNALIRSQQDEVDCVIEVESSINANANFHSYLRQFACQAASHALSTILQFSVLDSLSQDSMHLKVSKLEYFR
nr:protein PHYLLO, chloroplastic isoform X2 [Tanacetum cinerariifolium]